MISSFVGYDQLQISEVFEDVDILICSDDNDNYFAPNFGVDLIGEYDVTQGYSVFIDSESDQTVDIEGYSQIGIVIPIYSLQMNQIILITRLFL